jgi:hypothetical protein
LPRSEARSPVGDCHLIRRATVGDEIGVGKALDIVAADHRFPDMPSADTSDKDEIIGLVSEDTLNITSQ